MTTVPLPEIPCVRVRLTYNEGFTGEGGNRFYLSYAGSAPTSANCATLASDVASAWESHIAPLVSTFSALMEVDVLDIASESGTSGTWNGNNVGSRSGSVLPDQVATNVAFQIARRYRGGKPRMFLPPPVAGDISTQSVWSSAFVTAVNSGVTAFFSALEALSIGAIGALAHVNVSYYKGFTNITNSSGRERAVPKYRAAALVEPITGYAAKQLMGSQRRRRTATSP